MRHRFSLLALLATGVLFFACTGPSQTSGESGPTEPEPTPSERQPSVAQYETFDPSAYEAPLPERTVEVLHQVPGRLMGGRADEGVKRTVEGFRIQVFSARDKEAAQEFREKVRRWWKRAKEETSTSVLGEEPPIVVQYSQPYYRVRIGAFAERDEAEAALSFVKETYPEAFISRGTVTVTR